MQLLRITRYVFAVLFVSIGIGGVLVPANLALRGESRQLAGGLWVFDVALGIALLTLAVWVWPKKRRMRVT